MFNKNEKSRCICDILYIYYYIINYVCNFDDMNFDTSLLFWNYNVVNKTRLINTIKNWYVLMSDDR